MIFTVRFGVDCLFCGVIHSRAETPVAQSYSGLCARPGFPNPSPYTATPRDNNVRNCAGRTSTVQNGRVPPPARNTRLDERTRDLFIGPKINYYILASVGPPCTQTPSDCIINHPPARPSYPRSRASLPGKKTHSSKCVFGLLT